MSKSDNRRVRVGKTFKSVEPKDRKNSQMIRRLLYDTIAFEFERDCRIAGARLAEATASDDMRAYDKPIGHNTLYKAATDAHGITFQELNALAKFYKIPISIMLLFTRIRDELEFIEDRQNGEAFRILSAAKIAIAHLEKQANLAIKSDNDILAFFGHIQFKNYVTDYVEHLQAQVEEPELPIS